MNILLNLLVTALVIWLAAKSMSRVHISSFGAAFLVAVIIAVLNFLVGWLLALLLNIATLGLFYFTGLSFIISIIVNAIVIEIVDQLSSRFKTDGFAPSLYLAIFMALANALVTAIFY